jgi:Glycosyl transferases group 1
MRVIAELKDYPPTGLIGSFRSTHRYLAALADAGHHVDALISPNVKPYVLDGVRVQHIGAMLYPKFLRADIGISHLGDQSSLHKLCVREKKPSVRFVHGAHDTKLHDITKYGDPSLVVYNSHSMAAEMSFDGPWIVCHPALNFDEFRTKRGDHITLVNMTLGKGARTFDQIARWLPKRKFLGVRGGYGVQVDCHRPNIEVVSRTRNMRDDVYARSRLVLMPSEHESWGLVGIEAMCSGIPVIAHPTPGLVEALGSGGLFVDRDDIEAWVYLIESLDNPARYTFASMQARQRIKRLKADDSVQRFVKAVEALL